MEEQNIFQSACQPILGKEVKNRVMERCRVNWKKVQDLLKGRLAKVNVYGPWLLLTRFVFDTEESKLLENRDLKSSPCSRAVWPEHSFSSNPNFIIQAAGKEWGRCRDAFVVWQAPREEGSPKLVPNYAWMPPDSWSSSGILCLSMKCLHVLRSVHMEEILLSMTINLTYGSHDKTNCESVGFPRLFGLFTCECQKSWNILTLYSINFQHLASFH